MRALSRIGVGAAAGIVIAAIATAALAAPPTFPQYSGPASKNNPVAKPTEIVYTGDGSEFFAGKKSAKKIGKLNWTKWNSTEGIAAGYQYIDNCSPSCAAGKFAQYPIALKAFRLRKESKFHFFTRLEVTYTGKKPSHQTSFTWKVSYSHGFFQIG
jgi:hypothetical protein